MPTNLDPSRTTTLRNRFRAEARRRFGKLRQLVRETIVDRDALGLSPPSNLSLNQPPPEQAWRFQTDEQKVASFNRWFQQEVASEVLAVEGAAGEPWTAKYVDSAYRQGLIRAYTDSKKAALAQSADFFEGSKEEFLRSAFAQPERVSKARLLGTRVFEQLRGITAQMGQELNRHLADGLLRGDGPRAIARQLTRSIDGITRRRAEVLARTEVIHAHAEGQLDGFEDLGVEEIGIQAEWSTAGDDRVCAQCFALEGQVMSIAEARGLIPLHPNCRCAWIPSTPETRAADKARLREAAGLPPAPTNKELGNALNISTKEAREMVRMASDTATKVVGETVSQDQVRSFMGRFVEKTSARGGSTAARLKHYVGQVKDYVKARPIYQTFDGWYKSERIAAKVLRGGALATKTVGRGYLKTLSTGLKITGAGLPPSVRFAGYWTGIGASYALTPVAPWLAIPGASDAFAIGSLLALQVPFRAYQATRWVGGTAPVQSLGRVFKGFLKNRPVKPPGVISDNLTRALSRSMQEGKAFAGTATELASLGKTAATRAFEERAASLVAAGGL